MIDNSAYYNLTNPAFTEDFGTSMIHNMYPSNIDPISGLAEDGYINGGVKINNGQPTRDTYSPESKRDKEKRTIKNLLITAGLLIAGGFALHKLKTPLKQGAKALVKGFKNIPTMLNNGWTKIKNFSTKILNKIKI